MEEVDRIKIRNIKSKIIAMLDERKSLARSTKSAALPSDYWSDFCSSFDYMLGMAEESFAKLRLHTYHLTAESYLTYRFGDPDSLKSSLDELTKDIPSAYILNEPDTGIGFRYSDGRFLSQDIMRFQKFVNTLYRYEILSNLVNKQRCFILEIGGGYGGLAHHLSNICAGATYIILDLPETLLFSSSYLALLNPNKKIYLYDRDSFPALLKSGSIASYDFILLPNYKLEALNDFRFDLEINIASLQEMRTDQVTEYLDFVQRTCKGVFYSFNQDCQPFNKQLSNLSTLLNARFQLIDVQAGIATTLNRKALKLKLKESVKIVAGSMRLLHRAKGAEPELPYREYICKPLPPMDSVLES